MTLAVQQLINSFDGLSDLEKQEAASELLRRVVQSAPVNVPDEALVEVAEHLFLELDAREARDAQP